MNVKNRKASKPKMSTSTLRSGLWPTNPRLCSTFGLKKATTVTHFHYITISNSNSSKFSWKLMKFTFDFLWTFHYCKVIETLYIRNQICKSQGKLGGSKVDYHIHKIISKTKPSTMKSKNPYTTTKSLQEHNFVDKCK